MKEIMGKYASAVVLTDEAEDYALAQIQQLCNQSVFHGSRIRVMPDVHPGLLHLANSLTDGVKSRFSFGIVVLLQLFRENHLEPPF